jgi:hypothetical protein
MNNLLNTEHFTKQGKSHIFIADLETTTPNFVISLNMFWFSRGQYTLGVDMVEIERGELECRVNLIDFMHPTSITVERGVNRFNQKIFMKHAKNWRNVAGVRELIERILEVRGLELTAEAKTFAGLWFETV